MTMTSDIGKEAFEFVAGKLGHEDFTLIISSRGYQLCLGSQIIGPETDMEVLVGKVPRAKQTFADIIKALGFESEAEFHSMVSSVDISTPERMRAFISWKENDGTKGGLANLVTK
jgi:hypothetical protein